MVKNANDQGQVKKPAADGKGKADEIEQVIEEMQVKMQELESIKSDLLREEYAGISPQKSREMLEEIIVPSLELIRDEKKAKSR